MAQPRLHLVLALSLQSGLALADEATRLAPITVTSTTKTEIELDKVTISTEVITEADITRLGAVTLRDVFQNSPGVFTNPGRGEMSIRGMGGKGTLFLIDGRRIAGETGLGYELNRIPAASIERVEIVKGPMGALYGSDALGGIVNVITKRPTEGLEGSISASAGANTHGDGARAQVDGNVRGKSGDIGFSAYLSAIKTRAYTEPQRTRTMVPKGAQGGPVSPSRSDLGLRPNNTTCLRTNAQCAGSSTPIGLRISDSYPVDVTYREPSDVVTVGGTVFRDFTPSLELAADAMLMHETRDGTYISPSQQTNYLKPNGQGTLPVFAIPIEQSLDNERLDLALRARWRASDALTLRWRSYRSHYDKTDQIGIPAWRDLGYASASDANPLSGTGTVNILGHDVNAVWKASPAHTLLFGAERRDESRTAPFFNAQGIVEERSNDATAFYVQDEWAVNSSVNAVAALRREKASNSASHTSGNLGLQYTFSPAARLRASYAQGFRNPDIPELFINRVTPKGLLVGADVVNPSIGKTTYGLQPETSDNIEIGLGGRSAQWSYDIAAFHNSVRNRIGAIAVTSGGTSYRTYRNIASVRIQGLEVRGGYRLTPGLRLSAAATMLDAKDTTTGARLEFTPRQLFALDLEWKPQPGLRLNIALQHTGNQDYVSTATPGTLSPASASAYTTVNLRANWQPANVRNTEFFAGVDNLFNAKVDPILGSSVGIYGFVGIRRYF
ncbi:colicin I receptor precursor [mine drainage metagenome]|uniref:Colicin I receptor n=1 Tax=mine drainage metagenome TaxID=410659 RepID=A0A1J5Q2A1_9ZZZZ